MFDILGLFFAFFAMVWAAFIGLWLLFAFIAIASIALIIWALIDIFEAKNKGARKLLWALVVLFMSPIGLALYYFIGRKERKAPAAGCEGAPF